MSEPNSGGGGKDRRLTKRQFLRRLVQPWDKWEGTSPASPFGRKILSQRVPFFVILRQKNPPKVGMPGKLDAHQVIDLALHEIGALPDAREGRDGRIILGDPGFQPNAASMGKRQ